MKLEKDVLEVFDESRIEDMVLYLPDRQLERKLYMRVAKALEVLGGKWNRKAKGFLFDGDPTDRFDAMIQAGEVVDPKKFYQFFETPRSLVDEMLVLACVQPGDRVLEPSAGKGAIAEKVRALGALVVCAELNPDMLDYLVESDFPVMAGDFMQMDAGKADPYDKVVMNPPFTRQLDIDHVMRAFDFLKPGGVLVAIMSEGPFFRTNKKAEAFRAWMQAHDGTAKSLPEGTFKSSGTGVNTRIVKIVKEATA